MSYFQAFVHSVPTVNKDKFIDHANKADSVFIELGAIRVVECWGDAIPAGEKTDFRKAVQAEPGETVVMSFIEWPDKDAHDAAMAKFGGMVETDDRINPAKNPMPFDGTRMFYGGFSTVVDVKG